MKISTKTKLALLFFLTACFIAVLTILIVNSLVTNQIIYEAQERVREHLSSARWVYEGKIRDIDRAVYWTSIRHVLKKALMEKNVASLKEELLGIMSQEGFEKYGVDAKEDAIMLIDSTLVHSRPKCRCIEIPATRQAKEVLKKDIVANIVMLGALVAATHVVTETALEKAILDSVPKGTEALNQKAMKMGFELAGALPGGQKV